MALSDAISGPHRVPPRITSKRISDILAEARNLALEGRWKGVALVLQPGLRLNTTAPDKGRINAYLAYAEYRMGRYLDALSHAEDALRLIPRDGAQQSGEAALAKAVQEEITSNRQQKASTALEAAWGALQA